MNLAFARLASRTLLRVLPIAVDAVPPPPLDGLATALSDAATAYHTNPLEAEHIGQLTHDCNCLLYTSDAADDLHCVDLGGRRIIKKQKHT